MSILVNHVKTKLGNLPFYNLMKHTVFYGMGDIVQNFLSILLLPIYTRYLTPSDYGIIALLGILGMIVGTITSCGLTNGVGRYFHYDKSEKVTKAQIIWSPFLFVLVFTAICVFSLNFFSRGISRLFFDSADYNYLVTLTLIGILLNNLARIGRYALVFEEKSMQVNLINIIGLLAGAGAGILFVVILKRGIRGAVEAGLTGSAVMCLLFVSFSLTRYKISFSREILKKQMNYSLPLVGALFAFWFIDSSDRFLLKIFLPLSEVGLYNVGYRLGLIMMVIVGGFTSAWPPYYHKRNQTNDGQRVCDNVLKIYLLFTSFFAVLLSLSSPLLVRILTAERFHTAYTVVPWVTMAYMLKGPYLIFLIGVQAKNRTSWQLYLEGFAAIVNIALNVLLIPIFGREAAAVTTFIAYSIMVIGAYIMVMRINPIPGISMAYSAEVLIPALIVSVSALLMAGREYYALKSLVIFMAFTAFLFYKGKKILPQIKETPIYV